LPNLCVIPGDGIGLEVVPAAVQVLIRVIPDLKILPAEAGWGCFQKHGVSVLPETFETIQECSAALFGAVSSPSRKVKGYRSAILSMRQSLDLYANIRPVRSLPGISPRADIDMIIVRENSEGMYAGLESINEGRATATRVITREASLRIAKKTVSILELQKRQKISIVHKANILPLTDGLFRDSVREVINNPENEEYSISTEEIFVDLAAFRMLNAPQEYDMIITTNLFGDILSDAAAYWCGGMGLAPSLNLGDVIALAEPVHGSAPDIAGKGIANPIATILSAALLVRFAWQRETTAIKIEHAVQLALLDLTENETRPMPPNLTTQTILNAILAHL
jgi:homoisocitrate dehydrogenase